MIYVSSACLQYAKIKDSVEELALNGFKNIELSGGTKYYSGYEADLICLKDKYDLQYLVHNYFPPPQEEFILNIASLKDEIYARSLAHYEIAIALSKKLGSKKFGLHAGFLIDFSLAEVGHAISCCELYDREKSIQRLYEGFKKLEELSGDIVLYVENNVFSESNAESFNPQNPFLLTHSQEYLELKERIGFKLLLDVAHLRVSSGSLGLDFSEELSKLLPESDYIHISDNDGTHDQNNHLKKDGELLRALKTHNLKDKVVSLETYNGIENIKESFELVHSLGA